MSQGCFPYAYFVGVVFVGTCFVWQFYNLTLERVCRGFAIVNTSE